MTSIWAWLYCFSTWFLRLFTQLGLANILDVKKDPVKQIAFVSAIIIAMGGLALRPLLKPDKGGFSVAFDDFVCSLDVEACFHAASIAGNDKLALHFFELGCGEELTTTGCRQRVGKFLLKNKPRLISIFLKACDRGDLMGCTSLAYMYETGIGVDADPTRAVALYKQACDGGNMRGCTRLARMYETGNGVDADPTRAVALHKQACDGGNMRGAPGSPACMKLATG